MDQLKMSNSCLNCENIQESNECKVHNIKVDLKYTCDAFDSKAVAQ